MHIITVTILLITLVFIMSLAVEFATIGVSLKIMGGNFKKNKALHRSNIR